MCLATQVTRAQTFFYDTNDKWGLKDQAGNVLVPGKYGDKDDFRDSEIAAVELDGSWGFVDKMGKEVVPFIYDGASSAFNGFAIVAKIGDIDVSTFDVNVGFGFIDETGKEITPPTYDMVYDFSWTDFSADRPEKIARVVAFGKQGFIDTTGTVIIPLIYDEAEDFNGGGKVAVTLDGRTFYIDKTGKEIN